MFLDDYLNQVGWLILNYIVFLLLYLCELDIKHVTVINIINIIFQPILWLYSRLIVVMELHFSF